MTIQVREEVGLYVLAGQPKSSRDLVDEVRVGEALGCDGVIMHGFGPEEPRPVVDAYRATDAR